MATYYVRKSGNNASAGTSAGAAFLTITKALSVVAAADTIHVGSGNYPEVCTLTATGSAGNVITINADTSGVQTGDSGQVVWTAYTTSNTASPSGSPTLGLAAKAFYNVTGFTIIGGSSSNGGCLDGVTVAGANNLTFTKCTFLSWANVGTDGNVMQFNNTASQVQNITFDSCVFFGVGIFCWAKITLQLNASADYDPNFVFKNCLVEGVDAAGFGSTGVQMLTGGSGAFKPTAPKFYNSTFTGHPKPLYFNSSSFATSTPAVVYNCLLAAGDTAISSGAASQVTEDYNIILANTPRSNVTAGAHSISNGSYAPALEIGQSYLRGDTRARPFLMPDAGSPLLAFGSNVASPTIDALGFTRPGTGSVGYLDREDIPVGVTTSYPFPLSTGAFIPTQQGV